MSWSKDHENDGKYIWEEHLKSLRNQRSAECRKPHFFRLQARLGSSKSSPDYTTNIRHPYWNQPGNKSVCKPLITCTLTS